MFKPSKMSYTKCSETTLKTCTRRRVPAEKNAIKFVRRYRRKIASHLADDLYKDTPAEIKTEQIHRPLISTIQSETSEEEEEDDELAEDFQRMKDFLINSQAFRKFKAQLIDFLVLKTTSPANREATTINANSVCSKRLPSHRHTFTLVSTKLPL